MNTIALIFAFSALVHIIVGYTLICVWNILNKDRINELDELDEKENSNN